MTDEEHSRSHPVVVSSLTGQPMPWHASSERADPATEEPSVLRRRAASDAPEPGESNDARLAQDVPPHWGRGA